MHMCVYMDGAGKVPMEIRKRLKFSKTYLEFLLSGLLLSFWFDFGNNITEFHFHCNRLLSIRKL